jgi:hypothetical protein
MDAKLNSKTHYKRRFFLSSVLKCVFGYKVWKKCFCDLWGKKYFGLTLLGVSNYVEFDTDSDYVEKVSKKPMQKSYPQGKKRWKNGVVYFYISLCAKVSGQ